MEPLGSTTPAVTSPEASVPAAPLAPLPPPIVVPAPVFEVKPGRSFKKPIPYLSIILTLVLLFLAIVVVLYFWGAHLVSQGA
jgi:hypothetical protein